MLKYTILKKSKPNINTRSSQCRSWVQLVLFAIRKKAWACLCSFQGSRFLWKPIPTNQMDWYSDFEADIGVPRSFRKTQVSKNSHFQTDRINEVWRTKIIEVSNIPTRWCNQSKLPNPPDIFHHALSLQAEGRKFQVKTEILPSCQLTLTS